MNCFSLTILYLFLVFSPLFGKQNVFYYLALVLASYFTLVAYCIHYSHLFNKRGGWNKRGGGAKFDKSLNVEGGIF